MEDSTIIKIKELCELLKDKSAITIYANGTWNHVGGEWIDDMQKKDYDSLMKESKSSLCFEIIRLRQLKEVRNR
jgi:hypothetical protein